MITEKERLKKWCIDNPEKRKLIQQKYYLANKDKIKESHNVYYNKNKDKIRLKENKSAKERKLNNPIYKLKCNLLRNLSMMLSRDGYTKKSKTIDILGCSFEEFKQYLEYKFESWMKWDNYGKYNGTECYGWDIDHIIPISLAKNEEDMLKLNHYTNLQPLCSKVNRDIKKNNILF